MRGANIGQSFLGNVARAGVSPVGIQPSQLFEWKRERDATLDSTEDTELMCGAAAALRTVDPEFAARVVGASKVPGGSLYALIKNLNAFHFIAYTTTATLLWDYSQSLPSWSEFLPTTATGFGGGSFNYSKNNAGFNAIRHDLRDGSVEVLRRLARWADLQWSRPMSDSPSSRASGTDKFVGGMSLSDLFQKYGPVVALGTADRELQDFTLPRFDLLAARARSIADALDAYNRGLNVTCESEFGSPLEGFNPSSITPKALPSNMQRRANVHIDPRFVAASVGAIMSNMNNAEVAGCGSCGGGGGGYGYAAWNPAFTACSGSWMGFPYGYGWGCGNGPYWGLPGYGLGLGGIPVTPGAIITQAPQIYEGGGVFVGGQGRGSNAGFGGGAGVGGAGGGAGVGFDVRVNVAPGYAVEVRPYREGNSVFLALRGETPEGPVDTVARMDATAFDAMIRKGRARFAPTLQSWFEKLVTKIRGMGVTNLDTPPDGGSSDMYGPMVDESSSIPVMMGSGGPFSGLTGGPSAGGGVGQWPPYQRWPVYPIVVRRIPATYMQRWRPEWLRPTMLPWWPQFSAPPWWYYGNWQANSFPGQWWTGPMPPYGFNAQGMPTATPNAPQSQGGSLLGPTGGAQAGLMLGAIAQAGQPPGSMAAIVPIFNTTPVTPADLQYNDPSVNDVAQCIATNTATSGMLSDRTMASIDLSCAMRIRGVATSAIPASAWSFWINAIVTQRQLGRLSSVRARAAYALKLLDTLFSAGTSGAAIGTVSNANRYRKNYGKVVAGKAMTTARAMWNTGGYGGR